MLLFSVVQCISNIILMYVVLLLVYLHDGHVIVPCLYCAFVTLSMIAVEPVWSDKCSACMSSCTLQEVQQLERMCRT